MSCLPLIFFLLTLLFVVLFSAASAQDGRCDKPTVQCDDAKSLFSDEERIEIKFANKTIQNVNYNNNFVDVDIKIDTDSFLYRFVVCGCDAGGSGPDRQVVHINPTSLYISDSSVLALYNTIAPESIGFIKAVSSLENIYTDAIRGLIRDRKVEEIDGELGTDYAKIGSVNPALSIINSFGVTAYVNASLDIPYLVVGESQEASPLARAEWMKIIGLVLNVPGKANELFKKVEDQYNAAKVKAGEAVRRPSIFFNYPLRPFGSDPLSDTVDGKYDWTLPVQDEYITQLAADANADYRYSKSTPLAGKSGRPYNISDIVRDFSSADYLILSSQYPGESEKISRSLEDYLGRLVTEGSPDPDARKEFEKLNAVRCANVWSHQKRVTADGRADDYFSSAIYSPNEVLRDVVQAVHPYLDFNDRETIYLFRYQETEAVPRRCPYTVLNGTAPENQVFVDKKFRVPGLDRFEIADKQGKILEEIKQREKATVEVFFHHEDVSESDTIVTVRAQVSKDNEENMKNSSTIFFGLRAALGDDVRERNENGTDKKLETEGQDETDEDGGGGLSGGAIAGIVIGVLAAVLIIALILRKRRSRATGPDQAALSGDQYWDGAAA